MNISIRPEEPVDIDEIYELNTLVFGQDKEAQLVEHVRQGSGFIPQLSLVAISDEKIIGYILFSKIVIANGDNRHETLGISSVMVHPNWQRRGVGAKLITYGLQKATDLGFTSVLALGYEYYFPKFGFVPAVKWQIKPPFDVPADVFMALELVPNALFNVSGIVEFPVETSSVI